MSEKEELGLIFDHLVENANQEKDEKTKALFAIAIAVKGLWGYNPEVVSLLPVVGTTKKLMCKKCGGETNQLLIMRGAIGEKEMAFKCLECHSLISLGTDGSEF